MNIYSSLGVRTIINAKGTATRLSGGILRKEAAQHAEHEKHQKEHQKKKAAKAAAVEA